jgi:hypothetical protein
MDITSDNHGHLYAVDSFTHAYYRDITTDRSVSIHVNGAAVFNGLRWSPLHDSTVSLEDENQIGFNFADGEYAYKVICDAIGNVYIGGNFTTFSGVSVNNILKYSEDNGIDALGEDEANGLNEPALSLAVDSYNHLYVGGDFTDAGGNEIDFLARWNGESWSNVGNAHAVDGKVMSIAITSDNLVYISGNFELPGRHIAYFDGNNWHAVGKGMDGFAHEMEVGMNDRIIMGGPLTSVAGRETRNVGCMFLDTVRSISGGYLSSLLNNSASGIYEVIINPRSYDLADSNICGDLQRVEVKLGGETVLTVNLPLLEGNSVN